MRRRADGESGHDPYAALRYRDYNLYTLGRCIAIVGGQMLSVAVMWELYERTGDAMALGWVGLVQSLPVFALALPAGHIADRFNRRNIVVFGQLMLVLCSLGLFALSRFHGPVWMYYLCLCAAGTAGALTGPARAALLPQLVPEPVFASAVTWNTSAFQISSMIGPAVGGLIIGAARTAWPAYTADAALELVFLLMMLQVKAGFRAPAQVGRATLKSLAAGLKFVWDTRIILGTITLDLFAVLLGGAVTLLPVYAKNILHVGPRGLGWLQAAPSAGAFLMALTLAHLPPMKRAGATMLCAVAAFGAATIVFGFSRSFPLSLAMLFITGAVDNISVVVRHTLVQVLTPDEMRGRVSAVNGVFITASNGLGGFESGAVARFFSPVISVVSGGIGTILVVAVVAFAWPQIREFRSLEKGE